MRRLWISLAALTATGGHVLAAPEAVDPDRSARSSPPDAVVDDPPPVPAHVTIRGTLRNRSDGSPAIGATVVATNAAAGQGEVVVITDETGTYALDVAPGTYNIDFYYGDAMVVIARAIKLDRDLDLGPILADEDTRPTGCVFWSDTKYLENTRPLFGLTAHRGWQPVARDRTHRAWIAPVAGADPRTAVATVDDAPRLSRAPGIPIAFVQEVTTHTYRVPIGLAAGPGGAAEVALRTGSNELKGDVRVVAGADRGAGAGGMEALVAGPLLRDKAWIATGITASQGAGNTGGDGFLQLNFAKASEHQGALSVLAQTRSDGTRDGWTTARWVSKLDDHKLEIHALATAEQLELPATSIARAVEVTPDVTNRAGGRLAIKQRMKLAGYHTLEASAALGAGRHGLDRHADGSLAAGDQWQIRPNVQLDAGVRADTRVLGDDRATVVSPRILLSWDHTKEGRSDLFVAYQRVPHLDGMPGDWRHEPSLFHDELATGFAQERGSSDPIMFGIIARGRRDAATGDAALGVEGWLHYESHRTALRASATTLGRIATVIARRTVVDRRGHQLIVAASALASPDASNAGGAVVWRHGGSRRPDDDRGRDLDLEASLEGFDGTGGPAGRLVLGIIW